MQKVLNPGPIDNECDQVVMFKGLGGKDRELAQPLDTWHPQDHDLKFVLVVGLTLGLMHLSLRFFF